MRTPLCLEDEGVLHTDNQDDRPDDQRGNGNECDDPLRLTAVWKAWRGLVPISPNTTYNAACQTQESRLPGSLFIGAKLDEGAIKPSPGMGAEAGQGDPHASIRPWRGSIRMIEAGAVRLAIRSAITFM